MDKFQLAGIPFLLALCSEWPHNLDLSTVPLRITSKNYLFAGPSLYHPGSRIVKLQVLLTYPQFWSLAFVSCRIQFRVNVHSVFILHLCY